jgi:hypothetical protein
MHEDGLRRKRLFLLRHRKLDLRSDTIRRAAKSLAPNKPAITQRPRKVMSAGKPHA